jgi:hypothetical protein
MGLMEVEQGGNLHGLDNCQAEPLSSRLKEQLDSFYCGGFRCQELGPK